MVNRRHPSPRARPARRALHRAQPVLPTLLLNALSAFCSCRTLPAPAPLLTMLTPQPNRSTQPKRPTPTTIPPTPAKKNSRSGIQSIEVGFSLLDVLTQRAARHDAARPRAARRHEPGESAPLSGELLAARASSRKTRCRGATNSAASRCRLGLARLARVDGVKLARIALAELRDRAGPDASASPCGATRGRLWSTGWSRAIRQKRRSGSAT